MVGYISFLKMEKSMTTKKYKYLENIVWYVLCTASINAKKII